MVGMFDGGSDGELVGRIVGCEFVREGKGAQNIKKASMEITKPKNEEK